MRLLFSVLLLFVFSSTYAQQVLVGSSLGFNSTDFIGSIGLTTEIIERKTKVSINFDPSLRFGDDSEYLNIPVYLKYNIGKNFKVSPILGVFVRGTFNNLIHVYGFNLGAIVEKKVKQNFLLFLKSEMYHEENEIFGILCGNDPRYNLNESDNRYKSISYMFSIGTKFSLN